jgi:23S rRNA pseudouridine1911/1915/1917 synthase
MPFVTKPYLVEEEQLAFVFLIRQFGMTQGEAQRVIDRGRLLIDGIAMRDKAARIQGEVEVIQFVPESRGATPLFLNRDFALFEKPSGLLVHPKTMQTPYSLLDEIRTYAGEGANAVHRIDMETSGLVMASRHKEAERYLKHAFEKRTIEKSYLAWVDGKIEKPFVVDRPLKVRRDYGESKHKVCVSEEGRVAETAFEPIEYDSSLDATLLACYPHTGRTHQIRGHLFHVKHPILGDPIYGCSFQASNAYLDGVLTEEERRVQMGAGRLLLHAQSLSFHYKSRYELHSKRDFHKLKKEICAKEKRLFNR